MKTILQTGKLLKHLIFFFITFILTVHSHAQWQAGLTPADFNFVKQTFATSQSNDIIADGATYEYNLTPFDPAGANTIGQNNAMWNKNVLNMRKSFSICFEFRVTSNSGGFAPTNIRKLDGFALMLQRVAGTSPTYVPTTAELSKINTAWGGSSLAAQCNGATQRQLILEFDFFSNSNAIDGCPGGACDATDGSYEEHVSINGENSCTWCQTPAACNGYLMTPVQMKAGIGAYDGTYGPAGSTCRGNGSHTVTFSWTPNAPTQGTAQDAWGACLTSGAYSLGGFTNCLDQVPFNDPGVVCGSPNKVPCYSQGGTFRLIIDGSTRFTTNVTNLWPIMNPNNQQWDGSVIFGMSAAGYDIVNPDEVFVKFCAPLPVEFIHFDAAPYGEDVILNWATATEENNNYFIIQRSVDGVTFEDIDQVRGKINSSERTNYSYIDKNPNGKILYYRLKQVDVDSRYSYSSISRVSLVSDEVFSVYPNPNQGTVNVTLTSPSDASAYEITIFNSLGQVVLSDEIGSGNGISKTLNLEQLPIGIYIVELRTDDAIYFKKIVRE